MSARGDLVPPRVVFQGVRNVAATHLKDLPKTGGSGVWQLCVSPKGYVTAPLFIDILKDLVETIEKLGVPRPVILFLDGASPHISLAMAEYCKAHGIQPWLLKPNSTHLLQPLDLTFLKALKMVLKQKILFWQQDSLHVGSALTKYTIVFLLREAVEQVLENSPNNISSGFRRAGFYPWNPKAVDQAKMLPSTVFSALPDPNNSTSSPNSTPGAASSSRTHSCNREQLLKQWDGESLEGGGVACYGERPQDSTSVQDSPAVKAVDEVVEQQEAPTKNEQQHREEAMTTLHKFQVVFLSNNIVKKYEEIWKSHGTDSDPLYTAWLALKRTTIPCSTETVDTVLRKHTPKDVPRRAKKRGRSVPEGLARHNLTSKEWFKIHHKDAENNAAKKSKSVMKKGAAKKSKKRK